MFNDFFKRLDGFLLKHKTLLQEKDAQIATLEQALQDARATRERDVAAAEEALAKAQQEVVLTQEKLQERDATLESLQTVIASADERLQTIFAESAESAELETLKQPKKRKRRTTASSA